MASGSQPTPVKHKSDRLYYCDKSAYLQSHSQTATVWKSEIQGRIAEYPKSPLQFLQDYMPCTSSYNSRVLPNIFHTVPYGDQIRDEKLMYEPLIKAFETFVGEHNELRRVAFKGRQETWFPSLSPSEHETRPDLAISHPGKPWAAPDWKLTSSVFEVKRRQAQDPIASDGKPKSGREYVETLHQSSKNARNLLASNRGLFVFTIGIYGQTARFYRWDRGGGVVSRPFNYWDEPDLFGEFFYRFVHPLIGVPIAVAGADPTISIPTAAEKEAMEKIIRDHHADIDSEQAVKDSVWVWVPDDDRRDGENLDEWMGRGKRYFTVGTPRFLSTNLFGRSTIVWAVLEEKGSPVLKALKDSWRQLCREPETVFYKQLAKSCDIDGPRTGLPIFEHGGDLGDAGLPDQRTSSVAVRDSALAKHEDRSHIRIVLGTLGKSLSHFRNTKEMVSVLYDAIKGHQRARKADILHRDVSFGNVMIAPKEEKFVGFIHDFDYSSMEGGVRDVDDDSGGKEGSLHDDPTPDKIGAQVQGKTNYPGVEELQRHIKEKTGTFAFMAIAILNGSKANPHLTHAVTHDLESFYWLLIFVVLRHTRHDDPRGPRACSLCFDHLDDVQAATVKIGTLFAMPLKVQDNEPLTTLLQELRVLVGRAHMNVAENPLTYDNVLGVFQIVLQMDWPKDDAALPFDVPDFRKTYNTSKSQVVKSTSKRPRSVSDAGEDTGVGSRLPRKRQK